MDSQNIEKFRRNTKKFYDLVRKQFPIELKNLGDFSADNEFGCIYSLGYSLNIKYKKINNAVFKDIVKVKNALNNSEITATDFDNLAQLTAAFKNNNVGFAETSTLERIMEKLSIRSREAIVDASEFNELKEYLHVKRETEDILYEKIKAFTANGKQLVFLVGNVGDGKSHLLAHLGSRYASLFKAHDVKVLNDATESNAPDKTAMETLTEFLTPFDDAHLNEGTMKAIVAINLGIVTNLHKYLSDEGRFTKLLAYIEEAGILSGRANQEIVTPNFAAVSFLSQTNFKINDGIESSAFYGDLLQKVFSKNPINPFYQAYLQDQKDNLNFAIHQNFTMMMDERIQKTIINLLIRAELEYRTVISARAVLNLVHDLIVPITNKENDKSYLPSLIFDSPNRSELLNLFNMMDPIKRQSQQTDKISLEMFHANNIAKKMKDLLGDDYQLFERLINYYEGSENRSDVFQDLVKTYLRIVLLLNDKNAMFDNKIYFDYLKVFSEVKTNNDSDMLAKTIFSAILSWNGRLNQATDSNVDLSEYVVKQRDIEGLLVAIPLPELEVLAMKVTRAEIDITMADEDNKYFVTLDYRTYAILRKLEAGYILKADDRQYGIRFDNFFKQIIMKTKAMKKNILIDSDTGRMYQLQKGFGEFKLERIGGGK